MTVFVSQEPPVLSFSPKRTDEKLTYAFDFRNVLNSGESINSSVWTISVVRPLTTPAPTDMLVGSATIIGTQVFQQIRNGVDGVLYNVVAQITTNLSNIIDENALLQISNSPWK